jgi:hypothetical protein
LLSCGSLTELNQGALTPYRAFRLRLKGGTVEERLAQNSFLRGGPYLGIFALWRGHCLSRKNKVRYCKMFLRLFSLVLEIKAILVELTLLGFQALQSVRR